MRIPLILCTLFSLSISLNAMEKPYHHVYKTESLKSLETFQPMFRNGGKDFKWDYFKWTKLKKEIDTFVPNEFVIEKMKF